VYFVQLFNNSPYRDKKVVGVFVRFSCAASYQLNQDIQLLDFILVEESRAIIALITRSTSFDFAVTRSFRLIRMFLTYSSSEVLDCSLIDKVTGVDTFLVNKYVINVLSSDKNYNQNIENQNDQ
jgi:hypothetical protein